MRKVFYILFHLLNTLAKLIRAGGSRTFIAENLLLKQQLIIHNRSRQRAPNLSTQDRTLLGFWSSFLNPKRFVERLIGSIRRELLDQTLFWTATDLENKLRDYQCHCNQSRTHTGRNGATPVSSEGKKIIDINNYQ